MGKKENKKGQRSKFVTQVEWRLEYSQSIGSFESRLKTNSIRKQLKYSLRTVKKFYVSLRQIDSLKQYHQGTTTIQVSVSQGQNTLVSKTTFETCAQVNCQTGILDEQTQYLSKPVQQNTQKQLEASAPKDKKSIMNIKQNKQIGNHGGTKLQPKDFQILAVVGKGAFGKVLQVQRQYPPDAKVTQAKKSEVYAMKIINKDKLFSSDQTEFIKQEQALMTQIEHPFIVSLKYSFQTQHKLYLVMEFVNGGHLFYLLNQEKLFHTELAKFYIAEIVLAIKYLHELKIVHRDLKPENILLDASGHIKITDFGMAKDLSGTSDERSYSYVGTMYYMAPEVILDKRRAKHNQAQQGHAKEVDWWSLGVIIYEMFYGQLPFDANQPQKIIEKIVKDQVKYPTKGIYKPPTDAIKLMRALLVKDPTQRLGYGNDGAEDVMKHAFFRGTNWDKMIQKKVQPPFAPNLSGPLDIQRIDPDITQMKAQDTPLATPKILNAFDGMDDVFKVGKIGFFMAEVSFEPIRLGFFFDKKSFSGQINFDSLDLGINFDFYASSVPNMDIQFSIKQLKEDVDVLNLNGLDLCGHISSLVLEQYKQISNDLSSDTSSNSQNYNQPIQIFNKQSQGLDHRSSLGPIFEID